jgi:predicted signal transduction protein with EAL and GGDEF domain
VSQINVEVRAGKEVRLAVSAGASVFPDDGTTYETLLANADHRMYRDKAARRGEIHTTPLAGNEFTGDVTVAAVAGGSPAPVPVPHQIAS